MTTWSELSMCHCIPFHIQSFFFFPPFHSHFHCRCCCRSTIAIAIAIAIDVGLNCSTTCYIMSPSSFTIENVSTWIFKTKTSFHGQELNLPWWFGLACLSYSFSGVIMLLYIPKWLGKSQFPYYSFAYFLIFLQGM